MLLGLVRPTGGDSRILGVPFHTIEEPARAVGVVLDSRGLHPARTALDHLRVYASAIGVPDDGRAAQMLHLVGLTEAADRKAGTFSLGMRQRLTIATAMLGDPQILVLDEPSNGLDPEGIAWLRDFLIGFARSGRTVLVSSHLLREVEQMVSHVVIVSRGTLVHQDRWTRCGPLTGRDCWCRARIRPASRPHWLRRASSTSSTSRTAASRSAEPIPPLSARSLRKRTSRCSVRSPNTWTSSRCSWP